jgi:hypothetical protein
LNLSEPFAIETVLPPGTKQKELSMLSPIAKKIPPLALASVLGIVTAGAAMADPIHHFHHHYYYRHYGFNPVGAAVGAAAGIVGGAAAAATGYPYYGPYGYGYGPYGYGYAPYGYGYGPGYYGRGYYNTW